MLDPSQMARVPSDPGIKADLYYQCVRLHRWIFLHPTQPPWRLAPRDLTFPPEPRECGGVSGAINHHGRVIGEPLCCRGNK